jgi:hypothetical protein
MKGRTSWIGLFVACSIGVCSEAVAAPPAAPPAGYTRTSPEGTIAIEQYVKKDTDEWKWQFWGRRQGAFGALVAYTVLAKLV